MSTKFGTMSFYNNIVLFCTQNKRRSSTSACSSSVYNFLHYDLICPMSDAVHLPHPRLRVIGLYLLRHTLGICVLFYQPKKEFLHLLKSGKVPCEWSGKKTRCYKIRKEDVKAYLEERAIFPELYSAPKGWYGTHYVARLSKELPEDTLRQMHGYYEKLLRKYPDVVTVKDVVALTGYTLTTVHNWCSRGSLKAFQKGLKFCIPKIFLVDFFCSLTFRSITRKSLWHIQTLNEFSRKMKRK